MVSSIQTYRRVVELTTEIEEFAHIACPEGTISMIIERDRAVCLLRRLAPGETTRAVPPGWLDIPAGRKEKN